MGTLHFHLSTAAPAAQVNTANYQRDATLSQQSPITAQFLVLTHRQVEPSAKLKNRTSLDSGNATLV
jgi:hypothetical protein